MLGVRIARIVAAWRGRDRVYGRERVCFGDGGAGSGCRGGV